MEFSHFTIPHVTSYHCKLTQKFSVKRNSETRPKKNAFDSLDKILPILDLKF